MVELRKNRTNSRAGEVSKRCRGLKGLGAGEIRGRRDGGLKRLRAKMNGVLEREGAIRMLGST